MPQDARTSARIGRVIAIPMRANVSAKYDSQIRRVRRAGETFERAFPGLFSEAAEGHVKLFTISACIRREVWESERVLGGTARSLANRSVAGHFFVRMLRRLSFYVPPVTV